MTKKMSLGACAAFLGALSLSVPATVGLAQSASDTTIYLAELSDDSGASARIELSGELRMLSQRTVAAACYTQFGIDTETTLEALNGAVGETSQILEALAFGNRDMGIPYEENRLKTQVGLGKLMESWIPQAELAIEIASGNGTPEMLADLASQSRPHLDFANVMVAEIAGQYSLPGELLQSDALVIDIAGRQRMLAQQIAKDACLVANDVNAETARAELDSAIEMFDTSLYALFLGMPAAGIQPPRTPEIAASLQTVINRWEALKPMLTEAANGGDAAMLATIFAETDALTADMTAVVDLYTDAAKSGA